MAGNTDTVAEDYYAILGCNELSSNEQILTEYRILARDFHPDKNSSDGAKEKFCMLQQAKEVLGDQQKRKNYDAWRRSGIQIPYSMWKTKQDAAHSSMHWVSKKKTDPMLESGKSKEPSKSDTTSKISDEEYLSKLKMQFRSYKI